MHFYTVPTSSKANYRRSKQDPNEWNNWHLLTAVVITRFAIGFCVQRPILCERYINQESFTATLRYRKKFRGTCGTSHFLTKPTNDVKRKRKDEKGEEGEEGAEKGKRREGKTMDRYDPFLPSFAFLPPCVTYSLRTTGYIPATPASVCYLYPASVSNLKRNKIVQGRYRV